jgi:hypothetical protein
MIPRQLILNLVEGDDAPDLQVRFSNLDLNDYTSITMRIQKEDGTKLAKVLSVDPDDIELGYVSWAAGDLTAGDHTAEFEFLQTDTKRFTLPRENPVLMYVRRDLG